MAETALLKHWKKTIIPKTACGTIHVHFTLVKVILKILW